MDRGWELEGGCVCELGGMGGGKGEREGETLRIRERTPCDDREKKGRERDPMQYSSPTMDFHLIHKKTI